ncbi:MULTISPECIES: nSTAND1 domain-containing NTPase [Nostoc]|uniref:histidine kinase n=2 Tax=Nostoc TaxID=1177 RepID=A0ABR8I7C7_9NOSO|nr:MULTISPECIES: ATP-binding protein [Nostoc]MBD2561295.1 caspase family protein [Nostoc linckia FACHB-391]MBD2646435.1 caspase family protein [Nostoc foliaceum FACHB-393]
MARYALVLGIAKYDNFTNLPKAVNDAEQIAQLLREQGRFDVQPLPSKLIESENRWQITPDKKLTGKELGQALRIFLLEKAKGHEALIYFAGHGFEAPSLTGEAKGYLATSDCNKDGQNAIAFDDLNTLIAKSQLSSLVVLLDCCYAGSLLERSFIKSGFSVFNSKQDYSLITASRASERAREDTEGGIFTKAILKGLAEDKADEATGEINVNDLISFVSRELKQSGQEPIYMGGGRSIPLVWYPPKNLGVITKVLDECPYRGLEAFDKQHAKFFFGRQKVVNHIQQKLDLAKFVPIIGASGSGKSSVVRAGLIPQLDDSEWQVLEPIMPGITPLTELSGAFKQFFKGTKKQKQLENLICTEPNSLSAILENLPGSAKFLLVVDQFEEVFTGGASQQEKQRFIELLTQVVEIADSRLAVVITMRADFLEPCLQYPSLTQLIQTQAVFMPPLAGVDLKDTITEPAKLQGHSVEEGLVLKILEDVKQEPGFLPLLEFALTKLWDKRDRNKHQLTLEEYEKLGELTGALNLHAENVYLYQDFEEEPPSAERTQQEKEWIERIFLRLVRTGEGEKDTRQRQPKATLLNIAGDDAKQQQDLSELIDGEAGLVKGRLLVTGKDENGEAWIDLAHEALIEGWEQFAEWRKENRPLRRLINLVEDAFQEWIKNPQDENLMMGRLLDQVRKQWQELELNLSPTVAVFCQLSIDTELTHNQMLRSQAEAATNRIKDEFLAVLSHELRVPMNAIMGWSKLLQSRKLSETQTTKALETIERNASLQSQLIEDLLDISTLIQGQMRLNVLTCNLVSIIEAVIDTIHLAAQAKEIQIQTMLDSNLGAVLGDPRRLQQVIWNLLFNAIKFTSKGGCIQISLQKIDSYAVITVRDTGIGINPDFLPYIFDQFRQEDSSTQRRFGGLGLGLAIVRVLVELHGGTVFAESPGEGQGTTFIVNLPIKAVNVGE